MSLDFLNEYFVPIVVAACLIVGYCIKRFDKIPNNLIPTILAVLGAVLSCINSHGISLQIVVYGAFSGLASTGLHQMFKQIIEGENNEHAE